MKFERSTNVNLKVVMDWIGSEAEAIKWGGAGIRFPLVLNQLKQDINWGISESYSLFDHQRLLGFGQTSNSYNCLHFSRIIVNPMQRRNGVGTQLMVSLIKLAYDAERDCSLFVFQDNTTAINLYKRLHFDIAAFPVEITPTPNCLFMKMKHKERMQSDTAKPRR
jgi:ribosomal protein S18 acetylase RimI-like enzyme